MFVARRFGLLAGVVAAVVGLGTVGVSLAQNRVVPARAALRSTIPQINVENQSLSKVLTYLRDISNTNLTVNWKALEGANVSKDTPVSLNLVDVSLNKALHLALDQASPSTPLVFTISENVINITTQDEADKVMVTKVYIVDDLVMSPPKITNPPTMDLNNITRSGNTMAGSSSTSGSLLTDNSSNQNASEDSPQQKGEELVKLITQVIRPTIWSDNGGTATIKYFSGKLIVTAPVSVQEAIGGPVEAR